MIQAYAVHEPELELTPFEYDPGPLGDNEVEIDVDHCRIYYSDLNKINEVIARLRSGKARYRIVLSH